MRIKQVEIDLTQPCRSIYVDPGYQRIEILVRWGYSPLAAVAWPCSPETRTFSAGLLQRTLADRFGWALWEQAVAGRLAALNDAATALPPISVVVCTRDRAMSLERCLAALKQVDYPAYEVIVVDNCSRDPAVAAVVARNSFRYVREVRPGLDWARNRGWQEARHQIVAYVDDDALAGAGWLRGVAQGFTQPGVMCVTGMVMPAEIETEAQSEFETYGGMSKGCIGYTVRREDLDDRALFMSCNWGVGANMAFRRDLFDAIGGFDVTLDVGTPTCGAGDLEFFYRTVAAGYTLRYEPAALVRHVHRRDQPSLQRQLYNNGRSFVAYLLTIARNEPGRRSAVLWFGLRWWAWPWLVRRLVGSIVTRDRWTFRVALVELMGSCSGVSAYRAARKARS